MARAARLVLLILAVLLLAGAAGAVLVRRGMLGDFGWAVREVYAQQRALVEARLRGDRVLRDVAYVERDGWVGRMDLYLPAESSRPVPVVVYFHGGGWWSGSRQLAAIASTRFRDRGFAVANVSYRLSTEARAPAAVEDARCVVRWLAGNGARLGIDTARMITVGHSAGGHLALMAALADASDGFDVGCEGPDTRPVAVINWYGASNLAPLVEHREARGFTSYWLGDSARSAAFQRRLSPLTFVRAGGPAVVTIHGTRDALVPIEQSRVLHERLTALRLRNELIEIPDAGHGFGPDRERALTDSAMMLLEPVLDRFRRR